MPPRLPWQLPSAFQQRGALTTPVTCTGWPDLCRSKLSLLFLPLLDARCCPSNQSTWPTKTSTHTNRQANVLTKKTCNWRWRVTVVRSQFGSVALIFRNNHYIIKCEEVLIACNISEECLGKRLQHISLPKCKTKPAYGCPCGKVCNNDIHDFFLCYKRSHQQFSHSVKCICQFAVACVHRMNPNSVQLGNAATTTATAATTTGTTTITTTTLTITDTLKDLARGMPDTT